MSLLATKLYILPLRLEMMHRSYLILQLNEELKAGHWLTPVSALAGFGKATVVT